MRNPHWLAGVQGAVYPSNCIWFDTETKFELDTLDRQHHYLDFGYAAYRRKIRNDAWSKPDWLRFTSNKQFWKFVISKVRPKTRLYIFSHNGAFDLPVVHAFTELPKLGYKLTSAVADAPPLILKWKKEGHTIVFVDTLNIWRVPLAVLGKAIGLEKLTMPSPSASREKWNAYGKRDTEIIMQACIEWWQWLSDNDFGSFAMTLASQAMSTFRHRFMSHKIFIDSNEKAIAMSRNAYVGGRTEAHRLGHFEGEFYYLDINSMYPYVMRVHEFPRCLVGVYINPSEKELNEWSECFSIIAEVDIETEEPIYPLIHDKRLVFPVGKFSLTLCQPELELARERGHAIRIKRVAVYERAPIFEEFVATLYPLRLLEKNKGNESASYFLKIMMNSLYGKTGQRGRRYETSGECNPNEVACWQEIDIDSKTLVKKRRFGGLEQQWIDEGEARDSFPAIAAFVTSYARVKLWHAMETVGMQNMYYNDTDSIITNKTGYNKLKHLIDPDILGAWKLESVHKVMDIWGAKDYRLDGIQKTKGIRKTADWIDSNSVIQDYFVGLKGLLQMGDLSGPIVYKQKKTLSREYRKGLPLKSGKVKPLRLDL
jgi:hypothetical protein